MSAILIHNFNVDLNSPLDHRGHNDSNYVQTNGWKMHYSSAYDDAYLLYDGEIYNHISLREKVNQSCNINWRGHSDTETIVNYISIFGFENFRIVF